MEKYFDIVKKCSLFYEIEDSEIKALLNCLSATELSFSKNDFIFFSGEKAKSVGIVLTGSVHILQEDFKGNRSIIERIESGHLFGESFSCAEVDKLLVSAISAEDTTILLIDYQRVLNICTSPCAFHVKIIKNMLHIIAQKNVLLSQKIEIVTRRTTREKLLMYLSVQVLENGSKKFQIPFNRQQLADYLSVERSAMSTELSKMHKEGLIRVNRNRFEICDMFQNSELN